MFSGIVEEYAEVVRIVKEQENLHLTLKCSFVDELKIDQSISHNGVCLTVVSLQDGTYTVTAMKETIERSNIGLLKVGDKVNVERSMMMNGRLDGHIVQGHVDQTAECMDIKDAEGSWYFTFRYAFDKEMAKRGYITVDKGSVTVNGVSLTVCNPTEDTFQVAIIPYTYEHTNFHTFKVGSIVNIENNVDLPSLAPLIKIARALGVRLGTFLDDQEEQGAVICRKQESEDTISFSNNAMDLRTHMRYHSLSKSKADRHMEPFIVDVEPTEESHFSLSSHEGEEFIYVMEGAVEVCHGKKCHLIKAGDSIYYDSIVPHHVHGYQGQAAKILAVIYTPI
jgi:riboflavin synthase